MKTILVCMMLIIAAIVIYNNTIGGEDGTKEMVKDRGNKINATIESINP